MTTRGVRKIKDYLGDEVAVAVRSKRAADVVPVLAAKRQHTAASGGLSSNVTAYLEQCQAAHGNAVVSNKLSQKQLQTITALSQLLSVSEEAETTMSLKRAVQGTRRDMANVIAVSALERTVKHLTAEQTASLSASQKTQLSDRSLFVLADSDVLAEYLVNAFETDFGLRVLALIGAETTPRHPTFPMETTASTPTPKSKAKKGKSAKQVQFDKAKGVTDAPSVLLGTAALASQTCVVVATLEGFLTVDKRSAIWKHIGAAVVAVEGTVKVSPLIRTLKGKAELCHEVSAHREACLGHLPLWCVLATTPDALVAAPLDWLITLRPSTAAPASAKKGTQSVATAEVAVHYAVEQGVRRFQFLFGLLKGLVPHRGVVVHVATKEACAFLYDALYTFIDTELPRHVQILSDYEGESSYGQVKTHEDLTRLCNTFDTIVDPASKSDKTSAVLLSCNGLVPARGTVYLAYDLIVDAPNFSRFVSERLVPRVADSAARECGVERDTTVRKRGRSRSPSPTPSRSAKPKLESTQTAAASSTVPSGSSTSPPHYEFILVLLRPNEVKGALRYLPGGSGSGAEASRAGAVRVRMVPMNKPGTAEGRAHTSRHMFVGEKLQSMNRKLFAVQNAAYSAYKATMTAYCTMGPREMYNENDVNLESVAAEFGYTELPLLDLRLKDTVFRPKEDYFKAAKQKVLRERQEYKRFADDNIIGDQPEDHMADM